MKKIKKVAAVVFLLALIAGTVWIVKFRGTATLRVAEGPIFGTFYHIKYEASEPLDSAILNELRAVDNSLSTFNQLSTISRINSNRSQRTDAMLYDIVQRAQAVSEATDGAFDITVMPLVNAWGFGFRKGIFPDSAQVDSLRRLVGFRRISLGADSLLRKSDPRMMIDCAAIAKGYGVDRVAKVLRDHGVRNFMVEIGGEVVVKGRNPEGHPWQIGVSKPVEGNKLGHGDLQLVLSLENCALATSGNYRNFYVRDGKKYAHTIDPRTGRPVQHSLLSATVAAPTCATADAYATAFMVMGVAEARQLLEKHRELKAILIYSDTDGKMRVLRIRL